jgi:hypothetical protein
MLDVWEVGHERDSLLFIVTSGLRRGRVENSILNALIQVPCHTFRMTDNLELESNSSRTWKYVHEIYYTGQETCKFSIPNLPTVVP